MPLEEPVSGRMKSQSRLWENHVGRSHDFWRLNFRKLRDAFPESLGDVDPDTFHAAINAATPSLIRTEADERSRAGRIVATNPTRSLETSNHG